MDYVSYLLSNIFNCEERINLLNIFNLQLFTLDLLARQIIIMRVKVEEFLMYMTLLKTYNFLFQFGENDY